MAANTKQDLPDRARDDLLRRVPPHSEEAEQAVLSGILLKPLFRGTGYDKSQRNQGDFESDVYVIREV